MPLPIAELTKRFRHHPPTSETVGLHERVRNEVIGLAAVINDLPDGDDPRGSREKSVALTHLEYTLMWANAHIARNISAKDDS